MIINLIWIKGQTDPLQNPMWLMLKRRQIRLKNKANAHGVSSLWCHVDGRSKGVLRKEKIEIMLISTQNLNEHLFCPKISKLTSTRIFFLSHLSRKYSEF